jgi:7-cyano-7-deazaguanine synthase
MNTVLLLASGGLDSTTVAYSLAESGRTIKPVFFDYGQHCVETEWSRVKELMPPSAEPPERICVSDVFIGSSSKLIEEPDLWNDEINDDDLYVPYRTLFFFSAAASRAQTLGIGEVYTGFINSNHAKEIDCTAEFLNKLDALTVNIGPIRFFSPFRYSSKSDVAREAVRLGVPIGRTFSCQASSMLPCGACPNCVERLAALRETGLLS